MMKQPAVVVHLWSFGGLLDRQTQILYMNARKNFLDCAVLIWFVRSTFIVKDRERLHAKTLNATPIMQNFLCHFSTTHTSRCPPNRWSLQWTAHLPVARRTT